MLIKHIILLAGIAVFFLSVVAFSFLYGPSQRSFNSTPQVLLAESPGQIAQILDASGVKGRIAICFTRYLNASETMDSKDPTVTEGAMAKGIFRRVFHVAPDGAWPEISATLLKRNGIRPTPEGFIGIFENGRVYITPLSRFSRISEKAVVVVEPKVWTSDELKLIAARLKSGNISSDLVVIIRGAEKEAELFRQSIPQ
jgi:hypothetical protein